MYIAISYAYDRRFGLSEIESNLFEETPTASEIERVVEDNAADVVRIFHTNRYGKRVLESEHIYHDHEYDDAGEEGDFLYDDI